MTDWAEEKAQELMERQDLKGDLAPGDISAALHEAEARGREAENGELGRLVRLESTRWRRGIVQQFAESACKMIEGHFTYRGGKA